MEAFSSLLLGFSFPRCLNIPRVRRRFLDSIRKAKQKQISNVSLSSSCCQDELPTKWPRFTQLNFAPFCRHEKEAGPCVWKNVPPQESRSGISAASEVSAIFCAVLRTMSSKPKSVLGPKKAMHVPGYLYFLIRC